MTLKLVGRMVSFLTKSIRVIQIVYGAFLINYIYFSEHFKICQALLIRSKKQLNTFVLKLMDVLNLFQELMKRVMFRCYTEEGMIRYLNLRRKSMQFLIN